jgi:hypothetical protein
LEVTRVAKGKYREWLKPENLLRITNWAANGLTYAEMAQSMGIGERTLYEWIDKYPQISQAIKEGLSLSCQAVENALFRRASGQCVVTETTECTNANGEVTTKVVTRKLPPDTGALVFFLKNRMPDRYADRRETKVDVAVPTISLGIDPARADS